MTLDFRFIIDYTHEDVEMSAIANWNVEEEMKYVLSDQDIYIHMRVYVCLFVPEAINN